LEQRDTFCDGIVEVQRKQRDGEREDAITERLRPSGFAFLTTFAAFEAHDVAWTAG
jgi:hypothetical protein